MPLLKKGIGSLEQWRVSDKSIKDIVKDNEHERIYGKFHGGRDFPYCLALDCVVESKDGPQKFLVKPETLHCFVEPQHAVVVARVKQFNSIQDTWKKVVIVFHCCKKVGFHDIPTPGKEEIAKALTEGERVKTIGDLTKDSGSKSKANCPVSGVIQVGWFGNLYWKLVEEMSCLAKGKYGTERKKQFDEAIASKSLLFNGKRGEEVSFAQFKEENSEGHVEEEMKRIKGKLSACLKIV